VQLVNTPVPDGPSPLVYASNSAFSHPSTQQCSFTARRKSSFRQYSRHRPKSVSLFHCSPGTYQLKRAWGLKSNFHERALRAANVSVRACKLVLSGQTSSFICEYATLAAPATCSMPLHAATNSL